MNEEKDLLKISKNNEFSSVMFQVSGKKELETVAFALVSLYRKNPELSELVDFLSFALDMDKEAAEEFDNCRVEVPDFDKILKDNK